MTRFVYEDELVIIVDCLVCVVPMAVLKAHRAAFTPAEKEAVREIMAQVAASQPGFSNQAVIDWEQRKIPDHAHCHLRRRAFPNTEQWEWLG